MEVPSVTSLPVIFRLANKWVHAGASNKSQPSDCWIVLWRRLPTRKERPYSSLPAFIRIW